MRQAWVQVVHLPKHPHRLVQMNTETRLLVEIDQLVARLELEYPPNDIFDALEEYLALSDEFDALR